MGIDMTNLLGSPLESRRRPSGKPQRPRQRVSINAAWYKPGDHPYVPGMTVRSAIALAGGFTPRAQQSFVVVTRQNRDFKASVSSTLRPDDVVQVSERFF
jgi:protein involved in polysaccharide export with SLBB domain